jgi:hypothetical protein
MMPRDAGAGRVLAISDVILLLSTRTVMPLRSSCSAGRADRAPASSRTAGFQALFYVTNLHPDD